MNPKVLQFAALGLMAFSLAGGQVIPKAMVEGLAAEGFSVREKSQDDLLEWARKNLDSSAGALLELSGDVDPEIRMRSHEILKKLSDEDYLSDGQGYVGITMVEEILKAGPDGKPGAGIRISRVLRDSPADSSGLRVGDLIIALDGQAWEGRGAMNAFMEAIAGKKPRVEVVLTIRRDAGEPIDITVKLGKRPVAELQNARGDLQMLDKQAKEEHFREWLKRLKSKRD